MESRGHTPEAWLAHSQSQVLETVPVCESSGLMSCDSVCRHSPSGNRGEALLTCQRYRHSGNIETIRPEGPELCYHGGIRFAFVLENAQN